MTQSEIKERLKEVIDNLERMDDLLQEPIGPEQAVVTSSLHNSETSQQYALTGVLDER
jgi:hypothetical protein